MARMNELWKAVGRTDAPPTADRRAVKARVNAALNADPQERKQPMTKKLRFPLVLAAVLAATMIVTAFAVELTVGWESFLGRTPREAVTTIGVSAATGDYTLTLQEAIVDDDGTAFLLALTRNDGGVITGNPQLNGNIYHWDVKVDGEYPNMSTPALPQPIRSEDGKTVYYCMEFRNMDIDGQSLAGRTITFLCRGLADMDWSEEELAMTRETVSLAPLASVARQLDLSYEDITAFSEANDELSALVAEQSIQAAIPLTRVESAKAQISAVLFTEDGLTVAVGRDEGLHRKGQYLVSSAIAAALTDTRTGESWGCDGYVLRGNEEEFFLSFFHDCPLTLEDLPYVEVTVRYRMEKVLSDEPVELSFSADVGHQVTVELDQKIEFNSFAAHVAAAKISALRLRLIIECKEQGDSDDGKNNTQWELVYRDGSRVALLANPHHYDWELGMGWIELVALSEDDSRQLIDPEQVAAVSVNGNEIPFP